MAMASQFENEDTKKEMMKKLKKSKTKGSYKGTTETEGGEGEGGD